jgi:hypothetical protein
MGPRNGGHYMRREARKRIVPVTPSHVYRDRY